MRLLEKYNPEERVRREFTIPRACCFLYCPSLHELLKSKFGKSDGLASTDITLLDPAAGAMTFVAQPQEATKNSEQVWRRCPRGFSPIAYFAELLCF